MPDGAARTPVRDSPPALMRWAFEATASSLRRVGRARYLVADVAGTLTYAAQPPRKRRLSAHMHSRAAGGLSDAEARRQ